jgi:integrase
VKLQASVVKLLADYREAQAMERDAGNSDAAAADLIFVNSNGNPLNERNLVQRNFQIILERAKLPRIRLYDLRHTAATLALSAGVPAKVVSEQLGHASVAFTLDTYSHVLPHMQEAAAAQLEALLFEATVHGSSRHTPSAFRRFAEALVIGTLHSDPSFRRC